MELSPKSVNFLQFQWDARRNALYQAGMELPLRPKAIETLRTFLDRPGELLSKEELKRAIWPESRSVLDNSVDRQIAELRQILGDSAAQPKIIETVTKRGYRFIAKITTVIETQVAKPEMPESRPEKPLSSGMQVGGRRLSVSKLKGLLIGAILVTGGLIWGYVRFHGSGKLTDKDLILVTDFENSTGDSVFDGALRQGLSLQLEQSPFLNLLSEDRAAEVLALMARPKTTKLTGQTAQEVCQRAGASIAVQGSISSLGRQFVLGLKAINCGTGDLIAQEQVMTSSKEEVIPALGRASTNIRKKLGESLSTLQRFDVPLENVTTSSLDALRAYSLGSQSLILKNDSSGALRFFQQAVSLDPSFAMAHARLSAAYSNSGEARLANDSIRRAYDLRSRVSERENFYITSHFHHLATGNLIEAQRIYEMWSETYPRDADPLGDLDTIYYALGDYASALAAAQKSVKLRPAGGLEYGNLVYGYLNVDRLPDAVAAAHEAETRKVDSSWIHEPLYLIGFLRHDEVAMRSEVVASVGMAGIEDVLLYYDSDTAAYEGKYRKALDLTMSAVAAARRTQQSEAAAQYQAEAALREALVGNFDSSKRLAHEALSMVNGKDVVAIAASALALTGNSVRSRGLANDLSARYPEDTIVKFNYLPVIQASIELGKRESKKTASAIEILKDSSPFELGSPAQPINVALYPVYIRGMVYLANGQGSSAVFEFQKILDNRGAVINEPIGALAHLDSYRFIRKQKYFNKFRRLQAIG